MGFRLIEDEQEQPGALPAGFKLAEPTEEDPMKLLPVANRPNIFRPEGEPGTQPPPMASEQSPWLIQPNVQRNVNLLRPTLEYGPMAAVGALTKSPTLAAGAYAAGKWAADTLDPSMSGQPMTPKGGVNALIQSGKNLGEGYLVDVGGKTLGATAGLVGKGLRSAGIGIFGKLTGLGSANIEEAIRASKSSGSEMFQKAMRKQLTWDDVVGNFQSAFQKLKDLRQTEFEAAWTNIERGAPIPMKPKAPPLAPEKIAKNLKLDIVESKPDGGYRLKDTKPNGVGTFETRPDESIPDAYRRAQVGVQLAGRSVEKAALEAEAKGLAAEVKSDKTGEFRYNKWVEKLEADIKAAKTPEDKAALKEELKELKAAGKEAVARARKLTKVQNELNKFDAATKKLQTEYDKDVKKVIPPKPEEQKYAGMKALNILPVKEEASKGLNGLYRLDVEGKPIFERPRFATVGNRDSDIVMDISTRVDQWGKVPGDRTVKGVDELIRNVESHTPKTKEVQAFQKNILDKLKKTVNDAVPEYAQMRKSYEVAMQLETEIGKALAMGKEGGKPGQLAADTVLKKITKVMKDDATVARDLIQVMSDKTGEELPAQAAGLAMSRWMPGRSGSRSLFPTVEQESLVVGSMFHVLNPRWLALLVGASPRLVGEFIVAASKIPGSPVSAQALTYAMQRGGQKPQQQQQQTGPQQYIEARDAIRNYTGWTEADKQEKLKQLEERARQNGDIK